MKPSGAGAVGPHFQPQNQKHQPVALHSPIYVRGSLAQPKVEVDKVRVTARAVGAVILGAINPLLALIPLIDAGPGQDSDCGQLVRDAEPGPGRGQST